MTPKELAMKMLEWGELAEKLAALEEEISAEVLTIGKTQTVGNVRASFNNGRTTYDYEQTAMRYGDGKGYVFDNVVSAYTMPVTNWRDVCKHFEIVDPVVKSQSEPSVKLKLVCHGSN